MCFDTVKNQSVLSAHLLSINGQAGDSDGHLLPSLWGVEEAEGGLWGDAYTAGVRETQFFWHHHLAWEGQWSRDSWYSEMLLLHAEE